MKEYPEHSRDSPQCHILHENTPEWHKAGLFQYRRTRHQALPEIILKAADPVHPSWARVFQPNRFGRVLKSSSCFLPLLEIQIQAIDDQRHLGLGSNNKRNGFTQDQLIGF